MASDQKRGSFRQRCTKQNMCSLLLEAHSISCVFKESSMREFQADGRTISAYLAVPEHGSGPGVLVLHAWWGLTDPFRHVFDPLAYAGLAAPAPHLYPGQTTATGEGTPTLG